MTDNARKPVKVRTDAIEAFRSGNLPLARERLEWLTRKSPQDWEAWNLLGAVHGMQGDLVLCEQCCRKALAMRPQIPMTWNNLGNALKDQGRLEEAASAYGKALELRPDYLEARNNLGDLLRIQGKPELAERVLRALLVEKPGYAPAHNNLGVLLLGMGRLEEARTEFQTAISIDSQQHDALFNLGCASMALDYSAEAEECFHRYVARVPENLMAWRSLSILHVRRKAFTEAVACAQRAVALNPQDPDSHFVLGDVFQTMGRQSDAASAYEHCLQLNPQHAGATHFLAVLHGETPESAPEDYVRRLFDDYAPRFDNSLVNRLEYRTPQHIARLVEEYVPGSGAELSLLDLGCGTGLVGPLVRDRCAYMAGVDLSPKMIEMARRRGCYDELIVGDLLEPMRAASAVYDVIVSADVFVYIGNLEKVFHSAWKALRVNGMFIFSIELERQGDGFALRGSGRFAHTDRYIRSLAESTGFAVCHAEEVELRRESDAMIRGAVYVLARL